MRPQNMSRETLGSGLGFILLSAGSAIGIGNVWKFPWLCGQNGGAWFVLVYLFFLVILGLPVMTMEFAVGRAAHRSPIGMFQALERPGERWHWWGWVCLAGSTLLMMFYTTVTGWMLLYFWKLANGTFSGLDALAVEQAFGACLADPVQQVCAMAVVVAAGFGVCALGLRGGLERTTKWMMLGLLAIMAVLAGHSLSLDGAFSGLAFYLRPSAAIVREVGLWKVIVNAMNQAFFTLSLGIGCLAIFGSYIGRDHSLPSESVRITALDTAVALISGLIIFPACAAFGVEADAGPSLIFVTLPNIFSHLPLGRLWGALFFVFLGSAAFTTVLATFENLVACVKELTGWSRPVVCAVDFVVLLLLSLPCALGFNLWANFQPFGAGSGVLDLEDFILSNLLLPIGALVFILFCATRWKAYLAEANAGRGFHFPADGLMGRLFRAYCTWLLPLLVLALLLIGLWTKFAC